MGHRLSLPTRQVQELAPKNFVKLCSSVEKSAIETPSITRLLSKCLGFKQNGMTSKIAPQI
ncbi:hypothetical protein, partial [Staphylococcus felis]|uniref:hypothetical protein n=1 Tax=Staphylococcus felis TaxID=46127 RepID=UPI001EE92537